MKFGRSQFLLIIPLILLLLLANATAFADEIDKPHKPDELIIKFKPNTPQAQKDAILADLGSTHIKHFRKIKADHKRIQGVSVGNAIGRYKNHPAIEFIEPNFILTAVDNVYLNFNKPNQRELERITIEEAEQFMAEGHFATGSMGPKVKAAMNFLRSGGRRAIITSAELLVDAVRGKAGTHIVP